MNIGGEAGRAQFAVLADGRRHFHDGPIDLVLEAFGAPDAVAEAYGAAVRRFSGLLDELCDELPLLRSPAKPRMPPPRGIVARRMAAAAAPFCSVRFVTPMAAVAGAVADEVLAVMVRAAPLRKAYVNDGGDVALHLTGEETFVVGLAEDMPQWRRETPSPLAGEGGRRPDEGETQGVEAGRAKTPTSAFPPHPALRAPVSSDGSRRCAVAHLDGVSTIHAYDGIRGIATSGRGGRSFSLGIADSVTVLATSGATADAAATLIANAVNLPNHPAVRRIRARDLDPQSDLVDRLVTLDVGPLTASEIEAALDAGAAEADLWMRHGRITAAALRLRGHVRLVGAIGSAYPALSASAENEPHYAVT